MSKDQHQKQRNKSHSKAAAAASKDVDDETNTEQDDKKEKRGGWSCYNTRQRRVRSDDCKPRKQSGGTYNQQAAEEQPKAKKKGTYNQQAAEEQPKAKKKGTYNQKAAEEQPKAKKKVTAWESCNNKGRDGIRRSKWIGAQREQSTLAPSRSCHGKNEKSSETPHKRAENNTTASKNLKQKEFRASNSKKRGKNSKQTTTFHGDGGERKEAMKKNAIAKEDNFDLTKNFLSCLNGLTITETFKRLKKRLPGLERLLNNESEKLEVEEFIRHMLHVIATCCQVSSSENLNPLLEVLKKSLFFSKHITDCLQLIQSNDPKITETEQIGAIDEMISIFSVYLRHFPSSYSDVPLEMVQRTVEVTRLQEKSQLMEKLAGLQSERDEIIKAERKRLTRPVQSCYKGQKKPPDNYREIQICPTIKELHSNEKPFLRKNIKKGCYEDAEHYLDVQFRLYREDFIAPLREGIQEVINKVPRKERNLNIKLYHNVRIVGKEFTKSGIVHKVSFDSTRLRFTNWNSSKRLIFGSFLCLSKDDFKTIMFATVANRDPEELKKGQFDIHFVEGEEVIGIEKRKECYSIAESPAYFEAYRHVLVGLQGLTEDNLPFKDYLVQCSPEVDSPLYLRQFEEQESVKYNLSRVFDKPSIAALEVLSRHEWPKTETLPLNDSQLEAFHTAISKEFTVIQGPPGTGKTYVGLKIVQALLENRRVWDPQLQSPMLMVCFTNHALDQFLEGVKEFLPNGIIRVGGRCKSDQLQRFNIRNFVHYDIRRNDIYMEMRNWEIYIEKAKQCSEYHNNHNVTFDHLEEVIEDRFLSQLYYHPNLNRLEDRTPPGLLQAWLMNKFPASETQGRNENAVVQPKSKQTSEMNQYYSAMEGAYTSKSEEATGQQELEESTLEEQGQFLTQTCISNSNNGAIQNSETLFGKNESRLEKNVAKTEILRNQKDNSHDVQKQPLESDFENISKRNASEKKECPNNHVIEGSLIHVGTETCSSEDDSNNNREEKNEDQTKENDTNGLDFEDDNCNTLDNHEKSSDENNETIAIEQEADIIQSHRYQAGEEDMFSPIREVTAAAVGRDRNVCNAEEDESTWSCQQKQQRKKKPSKVKICRKDQVRVNKLLLQETSFNQNETEKIGDMWQLKESERIRLYLHWMDSFRERWKWRLEQAEETYNNQCMHLSKLKTEEDERVLRRATVIGMTTSCAARYHNVLQRVRPKIVVIEEAAEVLEAHILTSLTQDTQHVILIGDHKQLRPKPTVYKLAQEFNLAISLFERMVINSMDCKQLCIQHRMRPEIASLTKRIYDHEIKDSERVENYKDICGVQKNLFFLDHKEPENFHEGLQSYSNNHEANFVAALCRYLLQQGYQKSQITVLTMYTGQMLKIKNKMPLAKFKGVRLSAVDNFQGEENDIVILSLVRSNKQESIGFLKEANRICVSLSRARMGLYVVGNFSLMCGQSSLWKDICDDLKDKDKLGNTLPLICEKHKNVTHVKSAEDFQNLPEGGCSNFCEDRLECGHVCMRRCHPSDPKHIKYRCKKKCLDRCSEGHPCTKNCHYSRECGQCEVSVVKTFPGCGHQINTTCGADLTMMSCYERCERILDCNHQCSRRCSEACVLWRCKVVVKKTLPCNHIKDVFCSKDPATVKCKEPCTKLLDCQHSCPGKCAETCEEQICKAKVEKLLLCGHSVTVLCCEKEEKVECHHSCNRKLLCGHDCPAKCYENCPHNHCKVKVLKTLPCNHQKTMECYKNPSDVVCQKQCERKLPCGHSCTKPCGKTCCRATCLEVIEVSLPCGHLQEVRCGDHPNFICKAACGKPLCTRNHKCNKQCHNDKEPCGKCTALLTVKIPKCNHEVQVECWESLKQLTCPHPCSRRLSCGHTCNLKCGMNCEDSICKKKKTKTLPCNHKKDLPCSLSENDYSCSEKVKRKLPCGHEQQCVCHKKLEEVKCILNVPTTLHGCGHTKTIPCFQTKGVIEGKIVVRCDKVVQKLLPCGHEMNLACSQDPDTVFCEAQCDRKLPCGHRCKEKCGADCNKTACQMMCTRKLKCGHQCPSLCGKACPDCKETCKRPLPCNHLCQGMCSEPCEPSKCMVRVRKPFPCGHMVKKGLPCQIFKTATCKLKCQRKLPCGHNCPGECGIPCFQFKCHVKTKKRLPCGHLVAIECYQLSETLKCLAPCEAKLECGHTCGGTCGECQEVGTHEKCNLPCGRTLVCSHRCRAPCSQPCPPCTRPCQRSCVHKRCENKCGEECEPCKLPCACSCPHFQCYNLCNEICNRPLCNEPCQKKLRCGHVCIGLCGELCPSLCRVCNSAQLEANGPRSQQNRNKRFVQLFNCGHLFEVSFLDNWMLAESESMDQKQIHLKCCPVCSVPVFFSFRYSKEAKLTTKNLDAVKLKLKEMGEALSTEIKANLQRRLDKDRHRFRFPSKIDHKFCVTNNFVLLKLIDETLDKIKLIRKEPRRSAMLQHRLAKTVPQISTEIESRLQQLVKVCDMMEDVLKGVQPDIGVMIKLSQIAIIVSLVMNVVEVKVDIVQESKTLTKTDDRTLSNIFDATELPVEVMVPGKPSLEQLFSILAKWSSIAHLEDDVDTLRSQAGLLPKQHPTIKLVSFPGLSRDNWFSCRRGHVFARHQTTLVSAHQDPVTTTATECLRCKQSDSLSDISAEELSLSSEDDY